MKYIFSLLSLFGVGTLLAQNLVPNPTFEYYDECPVNDGTTLNNAVPWITLYYPLSSSDYFHECGGNVPMGNFFSGDNYLWARTGKSYTGMAYRQGLNGLALREYIQVKLNEPLEAGEEYCVSFYVSLIIDSNRAIDNIGAYFTEDTLKRTDMFPNYTPEIPIPDDITPEEFYTMNQVVPQVESIDGVFYDNVETWAQVSGCFTAQGGERFVTLGNLRDEENTDFIYIGEPGWEGEVPSTYYLLDDVAVYKSDATREVAEAGEDQTICLGADPVQIGSHNYDNYYYFWEPSEGIPEAESGIGHIGNPTVSPTETTTYTLTVKDFAFQETTSEVTVVVETTEPPCDLMTIEEEQITTSVAFNNQQNVWQIDYTGQQQATFECYSIHGVKLFEAPLETGDQLLESPSLSSGIYLYCISVAGKTISKDKILVL